MYCIIQFLRDRCNFTSNVFIFRRSECSFIVILPALKTFTWRHHHDTSLKLTICFTHDCFVLTRWCHYPQTLFNSNVAGLSDDFLDRYTCSANIFLCSAGLPYARTVAVLLPSLSTFYSEFTRSSGHSVDCRSTRYKPSPS